jgi:hypothetical protein
MPEPPCCACTRVLNLCPVLVPCTAIWGRTAASKGGARDPAAPAAKRATRIMADVAALDGSSSRELLFSTDGFRAYADDQIWVRTAPDGGVASCALRRAAALAVWA